MPKENPSTINMALYEIDEGDTIGYYCDACRIRVERELPLPAAPANVHCQECAAFAAGVHPDMAKTTLRMRSPKEIVERKLSHLDRCPAKGGTFHIGPRSLATILAALRAYQDNGTGWIRMHDAPKADVIDEIATSDGQFEPLDDAEIEDLCKALNCGEPTNKEVE